MPSQWTEKEINIMLQLMLQNATNEEVRDTLVENGYETRTIEAVRHKMRRMRDEGERMRGLIAGESQNQGQNASSSNNPPQNPVHHQIHTPPGAENNNVLNDPPQNPPANPQNQENPIQNPNQNLNQNQNAVQTSQCPELPNWHTSTTK